MDLSPWLSMGTERVGSEDKNHALISLLKSEHDVFRNHLKTYSHRPSRPDRSLAVCP